EAMETVGKDGVLTVQDSRTSDTYLDVVEGMEIDRGYISPHFVTNPERMVVEMEDCLILLTTKKIMAVDQITNILNQVHQSGREILIVAPEVGGDALNAMVINKLKKVLKIAAVKAPGYGDKQMPMLQDIAVLTGATLIDEGTGNKIEDATIEQLGRAESVRITSGTTTIIGGAGKKEDIKAR